MATVESPTAKKIPPLENGDMLDQKTFHARYLAMPVDCRAELIGGIVYLASPQKKPHSKIQQLVGRWLDEFCEATPGTEALARNTQILGPESEPQPDFCLYISPQCGGQVFEDEEEYVHGPPELIVEISASTESIDLHGKKADYEKTGVQEYVVLALRMNKIFWFSRQRGKYKEWPIPSNKIYHSKVFPGLWLNSEAILTNNRQEVLTTLRQDLESSEHAAFVAKLKKKAKK